MEKKTISEAMAELKLIDKKVSKKIEFIRSNCSPSFEGSPSDVL